MVIPDNPSHKWWVTLALMLDNLTQGLNFGTLNVALPSMMTNLRADVETIQWVVTSFMITCKSSCRPLDGGRGRGLTNRYRWGLSLYRWLSTLRPLLERLFFFFSSDSGPGLRYFRCRWACSMGFSGSPARLGHGHFYGRDLQWTGRLPLHRWVPGRTTRLTDGLRHELPHGNYFARRGGVHFAEERSAGLSVAR